MTSKRRTLVEALVKHLNQLTRVYKLKEKIKMPGTKEGGKLAAQTNKEKYGDDFYARIGAEGGKKGRTGGFYANRELASEAGRKGGLKSRRTKKSV